VCTAAAGARTEQELFTRLADGGVAARHRCSTVHPDEVTVYAVGLPGHTAKVGGIIWYGGGSLAADLTLPRLRRRWAGPGAEWVCPQAAACWRGGARESRPRLRESRPRLFA